MEMLASRLGRYGTDRRGMPLKPPLSPDAIRSNFRATDQNRLPLLTSGQVAGWLGISQRTVCLWAELDEIPAFKLGHQWRFREHEVRRWLEDRPDSSAALGKQE
jgi:excisionase family DNA binding protein